MPCAGSEGQECKEEYIGETERPMETRFREHHGNAMLPNGRTFASALRQHAHETGHTFDEKSITFLDRGRSKPELRVREACHIRTLGPSLNGGGGTAHDLPHIWDQTLKEIIKPPKQPEPQQQDMTETTTKKGWNSHKRGRPVGSKNKGGALKAIREHQERRRQESEQQGQNRNQNENTTQSENTQEEGETQNTEPKRKQGRPKGSKNKSKRGEGEKQPVMEGMTMRVTRARTRATLEEQKQ